MDREFISSDDRAILRRELKRAILVDPDLGDLINRIGWPEPRKRLPDFETLLQIIVSQQLSTHVSAVISGRLKKLCGGRVTWRKILNRSDDQLRQCGLSWRKVEYAQNLAEMIRLKKLDLDLLARMDAETVVRQLVEIRGFGRWSGEIFAMFALGHKDIFPADDLALQVAIQQYLELRSKPNGKQVVEIAKRWSPHRSAVALLMWKFYGSTTMD
jgi:DNA-3-methyladenine glycosylase II